MRSPLGDQAGKLSRGEPVFSSCALPVSISRINRPLVLPPGERYTMRPPLGDQLGKPWFPLPLVSNFKPLPSLPITAISAIAGPLTVWKNCPNPNAILSPIGDQTGASALFSASSKRTVSFDPSGFMTRMLLRRIAAGLLLLSKRSPDGEEDGKTPMRSNRNCGTRLCHGRKDGQLGPTSL